jgi:hypothetical protein
MRFSWSNSEFIGASPYRGLSYVQQPTETVRPA